MRIIAFSAIREYAGKRPDADVALRDWYKKVQKSSWTCFADIRNTFNSVDSVGDSRFVFNIKGNTYRLVAVVIFATQLVYIRFIGTHAEYERTDCLNC